MYTFANINVNFKTYHKIMSLLTRDISVHMCDLGSAILNQ